MITIERLKRRIEEIAKIGRDKNGGNTRLALTVEDKAARELFISWMNELNLQVRIDDFGNVYGKKEGSDPNLSAVMVGSHSDTVPEGGKFDGVLGVLGALEAIESFMENGKKHKKSIEIVAFTNEEGARFTPQMLGSGAVTGKFSKEYAYNRKDRNGLDFETELQNIEFMGNAKNRLKNVDCFIELHIEQGPVLDERNIPIGVVDGIAGFSWLEVTIKGGSNHSGTTPMKNRSDSLIIATDVIQVLNNWAKKKEDGTVLTIGKINVEPGSVNVIPATTTFTVDVRGYDATIFQDTLSEVKQLVDEKVQASEQEYRIEEIRTQEPLAFSPKLVHLLDNICKKQKLPHLKMKSGAGHDAMYMSNITDTAMIFVPSDRGISHSPEEQTEWEDIEQGVTVLYRVIEKLVK